MSMRIQRFGDWIEYITEAGKTFYYNDKDGSFQWDPPSPVQHNHHRTNNKTTKTNKNTSHTTHSTHPSLNNNNNDPSNPTYDTHSSQIGSEQSDHYPWRAYIDPETGAVFWYNEVTFVSQWELPAEFAAEAEAGVSVTVSFIFCALGIVSCICTQDFITLWLIVYGSN